MHSKGRECCVGKSMWRTPGLPLAAMLLMIVTSMTMAQMAYANLPEGWQSDPDSQDLIYQPLNMRFATHIGDMVRVNPFTYDSKGLDVSIGYNHTKAWVVMTLYIYLRSYYQHPDLGSHFRYCLEEAKRGHKNSVVVSEESTTFPIGPAVVMGLNGFLRYEVDGIEWGSYVVLLPYGERYLLLRVSFLGGDRENVVKSVLALMNDFMTVLQFPMQHISQNSRDYTPISEREKREYEKADLEVFPDDVRDSFDSCRSKTIAWAGVIEDVKTEEKEDFTVVSFLCRHYYFNWIEYFGVQSERIYLSSKGEGQFYLYLRMKKETSIASYLDDVGDLMIAYGKLIRVEKDIIYLNPTYIRGIDQIYFGHFDSVYESNERIRTHERQAMPKVTN